MHQQNTYQQFQNFTQPPPTIEQSLPPIDDQTIEKFLIDRNHLSIQANGAKVLTNFKINGRDRLNVIKVNLNNLIKQQKLEETNLKNNAAQISASVWEEKLNLLKLNQTKIIELLTKFDKLSSESTNVTTIKKKRKNKRKIKKLQKHQSAEEQPNSKEVEPEKQQVQGDLQESYEKYEVKRLRSANLKRISECKRQLTLLDSLVELKCIRRKNSNTSSSSKASSEKHFVEQIDQLKKKWADTLMKCNSQENELKTILTSTSSTLWLNTLFSNDTNPSLIDENLDFSKLLDIR